MTLELTPSEKKQLSALKIPKQKDNLNQDIVQYPIDNFCHKSFVKDFISARKLNWKVLDVNVFRFGTVGMHVDGLEKDKKSLRTLIIFLDGKGDLDYVNDNDVIRHEIMGKYSTFLFNDAKPHCFINRSRTLCRAIIAELKIKPGTLKRRETPPT